VGAGLGLNLKPFQLAGHPVGGLEPNEGWSGFARETLRVPLTTGGLRDLRPEPRHELILFTHVVEHLRDPRGGLEVLRRSLAPGGRIYLECPNAAAPFALPSRMFHRAHLFNFGPATLEALAAQAGLRVVERYADARDPTIAVLLAAAAPGAELPPPPGPENAARMRSAVRGTGWLGYHLRPSYLRLRVVKLGERLSEGRDVRGEYARLLERCEAG
jgi:SAM-dependent methyltransferase